jgi:dihydrofolate synthase / folylpolyglutamate synthase
MNYQKTLSYLMEQLPMYQRIGRLAYRTGLDNTLTLDTYFKSPHRAFPSIHVAGTNGKGSVSHMLASVLQEAGYKVGLYTSPHLLDFRERIRVNGNLISKKFVMDFVRQHRPFFDTLNASFFEISVFMAFTWFVQCEVDIAVIEVGLGGRLDATNIISPVLSVITNIGKDHVEILGDTLEKIAFEKAGIIKRDTPVVVGESQPEVLSVYRQVASALNAPVLIADAIYRIDYSLMSADGYQVFNVRKDDEVYYPNLRCGLLGHYQRKNTTTVLGALGQLEKSGIVLSEKHIYSGIKKVITNTGLSGRWQVVQHNPQVVCDTAHNADGLKQVLQQIAETPFEKLHLVLGFVNDKDIHEIFKYMPQKAGYYFTRLSVPRTMNENELAGLAKQYGCAGETFAGIREACETVMMKAGRNDLVVITGSNFLVADFLQIMEKSEKRKVKSQ